MADWQYIVLKPAIRYLERMPPDDQERIVSALDALVTDSTTLDIKPLKVDYYAAKPAGWA